MRKREGGEGERGRGREVREVGKRRKTLYLHVDLVWFGYCQIFYNDPLQKCQVWILLSWPRLVDVQGTYKPHYNQCICQLIWICGWMVTAVLI